MLLSYLSLLESWKSLDEMALALPNFFCASLLLATAAMGAGPEAAPPADPRALKLLCSPDLRRPSGDAALPKKSLLPLLLSVR